jgi:hypothetical protein
MIAAACILFMASAAAVDLVNESYEIPAGEWRYVDVPVQHKPALISAEYRSERRHQDIRLALMRRDDLERLRADRPHGWLAATESGRSGRLHYLVHDPGGYAVIVDNRSGERSANVRLRVWLDFADAGPPVTQLSPRRQLTVIAVSFAVFFGIVTWSARRLLHSLRK